MEHRFLTNERNRQNHMKRVINKQQERERKAKKVREKCCVELEGSIIEVDETYDSAGDSQGDYFTSKFGPSCEEAVTSVLHSKQP